MVRPIIKCKECNEEKPHKAKGYCLQCYKRINNRKYYHQGKPNQISVKCKSCGEIKPHKAHGLCGNCYAAIRQRKIYNESKEVREKKANYGKKNRERKNEISNKSYHRNKLKRVIQTTDCKKFRYKKRTCQICGSLENLEVHHLTYEKESKIIILCKKCHQEKHRKHVYQWW